MKLLLSFIVLMRLSFGCEEPCQGKVDFKKIRDYLTQQMSLNLNLDQSSLGFVGAHGVHIDKEELRGYGFFPNSQVAGIYRLDCNHQEEFSFQRVDMTPVLSEMSDPLFSAIRQYFLWESGYPEILNLWVSKTTLSNHFEGYDHWLVLVNLPGDKGAPSWWKFVEFRAEKGSLDLEVWAGAFAYPVTLLAPPIF
jgi:hypothetical protein